MDYQAWVDRLKTFAENVNGLSGESFVKVDITPPVSTDHLEGISVKWPNGLPDSLRRFWTEGAGKIRCTYSWSPLAEQVPLLNEVFEYHNFIHGGADFEALDSIYPGNAEELEWIESESDDEAYRNMWGEEGYALWHRCAVFHHVGNGDSLGLDPTVNPNDPAVVYLVGVLDGSRQISPSFTEFLETWEKLSYIGPEIWFLDPWLDRELGQLDPTKHKTAELRKLLTPR